MTRWSRYSSSIPSRAACSSGSIGLWSTHPPTMSRPVRWSCGRWRPSRPSWWSDRNGSCRRASSWRPSALSSARASTSKCLGSLVFARASRTTAGTCLVRSRAHRPPPSSTIYLLMPLFSWMNPMSWWANWAACTVETALARKPWSISASGCHRPSTTGPCGLMNSSPSFAKWSLCQPRPASMSSIAPVAMSWSRSCGPLGS